MSSPSLGCILGLSFDDTQVEEQNEDDGEHAFRSLPSRVAARRWGFVCLFVAFLDGGRVVAPRVTGATEEGFERGLVAPLTHHALTALTQITRPSGWSVIERFLFTEGAALVVEVSHTVFGSNFASRASNASHLFTSSIITSLIV